jgi:hypothetical protein
MLQEDDLPMDWKSVMYLTSCIDHTERTTPCNRRELVHMLHMRRKAEIQILGGIINVMHSFAREGFGKSQFDPTKKTPISAAKANSFDESSGEKLRHTTDASLPGGREESVESGRDMSSTERHDGLYDYVKAKLCEMLHKVAETEEHMDI